MKQLKIQVKGDYCLQGRWFYKCYKYDSQDYILSPGRVFGTVEP